MKKVNLQVNANLQTFFGTQLHQNMEFKAEYERFERLLNVDERYLNGLKVGEMRYYQFNNGDAIVYSLITETFDNGIKNYLIEIENFLSKKAWDTLKQHQGVFKRCFRLMRDGVARADSIDFYIQIAVAIGILSILFAAKFLSQDASEMKTRPPVPEQQVPKLPQNKPIER